MLEFSAVSSSLLCNDRERTDADEAELLSKKLSSSSSSSECENVTRRFLLYSASAVVAPPKCASELAKCCAIDKTLDPVSDAGV